ncbi:MAG: tetratricopeptide repeat protein [Chloroflexota bacterium]
MVTSLLRTKLYIPSPRPELISRPRLRERLNKGNHRKLTLISAPAGFGKTTLVSEWIASNEHPTAWLSLDERDNDAVRFLAYLIAALQTVADQVGKEALALLEGPQQPPLETILTTLLNEITTIPDHFTLVLDDYHLIEAKAVDEALSFLLEHLPPQMHLLITTREDPPLPLARYRARSQMSELRANDLRFTAAESAEFLNHVMDLTLLPEDVAALERRTEGWIAGLQLAAISMQGRTDTDSFIQAFTGSHHFILDYLIEEVLQSQPEAVRSFLLQTAILQRLSGPLCEAVWFSETGSKQESGKAMIATLARNNLFIIPLDNERHWYRYHHLFADMLQVRLQEEHPQQVPILHQRASAWYEQNGFRAEAILHAIAAEDFIKAADLVELTWPALHRSDFRSAELLGWLEAIPDDFIRARPVLSVGYAWELLNGGQFEVADTHLRDAERWMSLTNDASVDPKSTRFESEGLVMIVGDEAEFYLLPTEIASARAYLAQAMGDVSATMRYARRALDLIPEKDYIRRGPAASLLGLAYWTTGQLELAYDALAEGMMSFQQAGNILFAISGTFGLADIRIGQGQLQAAIDTYEKALQLVIKEGDPTLPGTADLHLGLSELYREQNKLDAAQKHLLKSQELGGSPEQQIYDYHWFLVQARLRHEQDDLAGALHWLDKAEDLFIHIHIPDLRPVAAMKARVRLAHGQIAEALHWVSDRGLAVDDELDYLTEFEHITLARILIAAYKRDRMNDRLQDAIKLLERLLKAAETDGRLGSALEILLLQAVAYQAEDNTPLALAPLERALLLAESEGYVQTFVDEGAAMVHLLQEALKREIGSTTYIQRLLTAFPEGEITQATVPPPPKAIPELIEPLSERELDVLRLLKTYMNGPEIARELMISLNTMRTHTKNIYHKLGVNNRQAAVRRAEELDLPY